MRIICLHENKLAPLLQVGAAIEDLTPNSLWDTPYHLVSMSDEQFQALREIYGETVQHEMEDVTPTIATRPLTEAGGFLYCRGGRIPNGTRLHAHHLSRDYEAEVRGGKVWFNQKAYDSPSKAARAITKTQTNGWRFWGYYDEELGQWRNLTNMRTKERQSMPATSS